KPLVRVLDSLDTLQWKALPQHRLAAAANDRIKKITTDHATGRGEEGKIEHRTRMLETTSDNEVIVDFGKRQERRIERSDNDHRWRCEINRQANNISFQPPGDRG